VLEHKPEDLEGFACKWFSDPKREDEVLANGGGVGFDMVIYS
jgi:hypothetical protein